MTHSTRVFHRVLSADGSGYDVAPDGTPSRTLIRTPTGGNLATCPRSLATAGTIRERLDRLARNNRESAAKLAAIRVENARLAGLVADARKYTRTRNTARVSTAAGRNTADELTLAHPRIVIGPMGIYEENY
jgi:hypothetical protein